MTVVHKFLTWLNLHLSAKEPKRAITELKKLGTIKEFYSTRIKAFYQVFIKFEILPGHTIQATGIDLDPEIAALKGLMECYERYFGLTPIHGEQIVDIAKSNADEFYWGEFLTHNSESMKPSKGIYGWKMGSFEAIRKWFPIGLVAFGKCIDGRDNFCTSSSGMAADRDFDIATGRALFELIERHAVMLHWVTKTSPKKLNRGLVLNLVPEILTQVSELESKGFTVTFLDVMIDRAPPTVLCTITSNSYPAISAGAACKSNWWDAIAKAFTEATGYLYPILNGYQVKALKNPEDVKTVADHPALYIDGTRNAELEFLFRGQDIGEFRRTTYRGPKDWDAYVIELTHPHSPIRVARVVSSKCIPMAFGYGNEAPEITQRLVDEAGLSIDETSPITPIFMG